MYVCVIKALNGDMQHFILYLRAVGFIHFTGFTIICVFCGSTVYECWGMWLGPWDEVP